MPSQEVQPGRRSSLPPGHRIGRYELLTRIGEGGMADVFLARQVGPENFRKLVVIKRIHPHLARVRYFIDMFFDEARIAAKISHPRVVQIFDLGESEGTYYIAMEYLAGQSLAAVLRHSRATGELPAPDLIARIVADAADGLHAAHELRDLDGRSLEVVHRDVSPSNIIILYDGTVKVVDFGVAKARGRVVETTGGQIKGKFAYMSPEQLTGKPIDRRADVFALGVVLWESLCVRRLFRQASDGATVNAVLSGPIRPPSCVRSGVDGELDRITLKALNRSLEGRFATTFEVKEALEDYLHGRSERISGTVIRDFMQRNFARQIGERETLLRRVEEVITGELDIELSGLFESPAFGTPASADDESDDLGVAVESQPEGAAGKRRAALAVGGALGAAACAAALVGLWSPMIEPLEAVPQGDPPAHAVPAAVAPVAAVAAPSPASEEVQLETPPPTKPSTGAALTESAPPAGAAREEGAVAEPPLEVPEAPRAAHRATPATSRRLRTPITAAPASPAAKSGRLYLATMPRSIIYEGARELGSTPLVNVPLPAGQHTLTAVDPKTGQRSQLVVTVEADRETRLLKKLIAE